jgi:succinate dehydrogenase / fumarate reductase flavoprotein subunit
MDLAPRDVVARAIEQEIAAGRGFDGGYVHLDLRHLGEERIRERLPGIRLIAMDFAGVDPITGPIPVQPAQHYSMGGIDVGIEGESCLPGLYAAGECACISVHGANRLGGNSLLETVVFGRLVADTVSRDVQSVPSSPSGPVLSAMKETEERIVGILGRNGGEPLFPVIDSLKETMNTKFGIFREGNSMVHGLAEIHSLRKRLENISISDKERAANQALIRYLELEYMVPVAEATALGAIHREESRGSHTRTDFPVRDDDHFLTHTIIRVQNGEIALTYAPVTLGMFTPEERVY